MRFKEFLMSESAKQTAALVEAKREMSARFLRPQAGLQLEAYAARTAASARPVQNVVGVGIDEKLVDGLPTGVPAVKFLVRRKFAASDIPRAELLPNGCRPGNGCGGGGADRAAGKAAHCGRRRSDAQSTRKVSSRAAGLLYRFCRPEQAICHGRHVRPVGEERDGQTFRAKQ